MPKRTKLIVSWNVNGVRAAVRKGFLEWMARTGPEALCIQETKAHVEQLSDDVLHPNGYLGLWNCADRRGYSGVATFLKEKPRLGVAHFDDRLMDEEGRVVLTEHAGFYLFNVYFPNGGRGPDRLAYKLRFYDRFLELMEAYRKRKPVMVCGDVNTAHREIDLARPKENVSISGFLPVERAWLDELERRGYVDTFRHFHPAEAGRYSWWDLKSRARERNVGWRIDYFWADESFMPSVKDAFIWDEVEGSDHAPVGITVDAAAL